MDEQLVLIFINLLRRKHRIENILFVIIGLPGTCVSVKSLSYVSIKLHSVNGPVPLTVIAAILT